MQKSRIKVIFIAGPARSGSTILSNILGQIGGFFNAGELIEFWDRGLEWPCSCGYDVNKCEIWSKVVDEVLNDKKRSDIQRIIELRDRAAHSRMVLKQLLMPGEISKLKSQLGDYLAILTELYQQIQSATNCDIIVDASKNTGYGYVLGMVPVIDLYIVHLVRDSRATAYSWSKKKQDLWRENSAKVSLVWNLRNISAEGLGKKWPRKYIRVLYEDFVMEPQESIECILSLINENTRNLPFVSEREVKLSVSHGICGNPDRFKNGVIKLKMDQRWRKIRRIDMFLSTLLTWPLLLRYQYPLSPKF